VHKEEPIPPSEYLTQLENDPVEEIEPPTAVRYWSDFNHSYFSSHSLHVLPDLPDSGEAESILGWAQSKDEFSRVFAVRQRTWVFYDCQIAYLDHRRRESMRTTSDTSQKNVTICRYAQGRGSTSSDLLSFRAFK
jgi:hypothetical protein